MMRIVPILLACAAAGASESSTVRDLVDKLRELDAEVALIERESALPVERQRLWSGAARGMVEAVDPYGGYLDADEVAIYGLGVEPLAVGCGFDWRQESDGRVFTTRVVPGSPAAEAKLHPGAEIISVNGLEPRQLGRRQTAEALARSGDQVALRVRLGDDREVAVELKRIELSDDGLARARIDDGIATVRIGRFLPSRDDGEETATAAGLRRALAAMPGARALVLDLRGCAGGNLQSAVDIAAAWLPAESTIVEQIGRDPSRARSWKSSAARLPELPIVVLVDGRTASSAEVLAHALRHHRRSPVVGSRTTGKGSVQQLFLLPHGDALRLTVARLRAPSGLWIDQPLMPDVVVDQDLAVTIRRWMSESAGAPPFLPDPQFERAVEIARALAAQVR